MGGFPTRADVDPSPNPAPRACIEKPSPFQSFLSHLMNDCCAPEVGRASRLSDDQKRTSPVTRLRNVR
jgi:hypothetical protein